MNILHFIQLLIIDIWILYSLKVGYLNKLISPKFNSIMLITSFFFICLAIYIIYLIIRKRIKIIVKFDSNFLLILILVIALFSDKNIQAKGIIKNKYKNSFSFSKIDNVLKGAGLTDNKSENIVNKFSVEKNSAGSKNELSYKHVDLMQIYQDLQKKSNKNDIEDISYKIETIGQIYEPSDNNMQLYEKEFMLVRFMMICCIADMAPVAIVVENNANIDFSDDEQWLRIKGEIRFIKNAKTGEYIGFLEDEKIEKINEPEIPYLNPINYMAEN